jgi:enamine deaminase RidA (YjgF/YER057c/UK114 family)
MKFNTALLQSLSNPELLRMVYGAESVPQEIAQELVRRFDKLVTSGQIPDSSEGYEDELQEKEDELQEKEDEISDMREQIRHAISNLEDI